LASPHDYPNYYDYLSSIFLNVKQKPRVVEEHDRFSAIISSVEAGTGVAIATQFGYSFDHRLKFLHITPVPKPNPRRPRRTKGRLSAATEASGSPRRKRLHLQRDQRRYVRPR
jgi:DNA-binding transcriptional LysR family regulator